MASDYAKFDFEDEDEELLQNEVLPSSGNAPTTQNSEGEMNPPVVEGPPNNPLTNVGGYTPPGEMGGGDEVSNFQFEEGGGEAQPYSSQVGTYTTDQGGGQVSDMGFEEGDAEAPAEGGGTEGPEEPGSSPLPEGWDEYVENIPKSVTESIAALGAQGPQGGSIQPRSESELQRAMQQFALDWMRNPSRYDNDLVQKAMDAVKADMARTRQEQYNQLNAWMADRGILSSTPGGELMRDQLNRLGEQENREMLSILMDQARTQAADRSAAFGAGLSGSQFQEGQYQFDVDAQLRSRALAIQKYGIDSQTAVAMSRMQMDARMFGVDVAIRNRALDLQERGLDQDEAHFQADMEFKKSEVIRDQENWDKDFGFRQDEADREEERWRDKFGFEQDEAGRYWDWMYGKEGMGRNQTSPSYKGSGGYGSNDGYGGKGKDPYDSGENGEKDW